MRDRLEKINHVKNAVAYILLFLGIQFICTTAFYAVSDLMFGASTQASIDFSNKYTTIILALSEVLTFIAVYFIAKFQKKSLNELVFEEKAFCSDNAVWLLLAGLCGNIFTTAIMEAIPFSEELVEDYSQSVGVLDSSFLLANILAVAILAPIVEELIFRGLALSRFRKAMPDWAAVVLQAAIFGLIHGNILWVIYAFVFGLILGYVRLKSGTLKASILLHIGFNASSFIAGLLFIFLPQTTLANSIVSLIFGALLFVFLRLATKEKQ